MEELAQNLYKNYKQARHNKPGISAQSTISTLYIVREREFYYLGVLLPRKVILTANAVRAAAETGPLLDELGCWSRLQHEPHSCLSSEYLVHYGATYPDVS